jgi:hypothetical protein
VKIDNFFSELKRDVYKIAIAYAVTAWAIAFKKANKKQNENLHTHMLCCGGDRVDAFHHCPG